MRTPNSSAQTNTATGDTRADSTDSPAVCDRHMRSHARVESTIERVKNAGGSRFPFTAFDANQAWLLLAVIADTAVRWFQALCLRGPLPRAKHKALRWRLWHTPARIVRHARRQALKLPDDLKASHTILAARMRINMLNRQPRNPENRPTRTPEHPTTPRTIPTHPQQTTKTATNNPNP